MGREACEDIDEEDGGEKTTHQKEKTAANEQEKREERREKTTHQKEKTAANEQEKREERREKTTHIREMTTYGGEMIDQEDRGDQFDNSHNNSISEFLASDNDNEE